MNRKHLISLAILIAVIIVIYMAATEKRIHPPKEQWIRDHKITVENNKNPDKYCLECHKQRFGQTKENFCNDCHKKNNIPPVKY